MLGYILYFLIILSLIFALVVLYIDIRNDKVIEISENIKALKILNNLYYFKKINKSSRIIHRYVKSLKTLKRITLDEIVGYDIENNIDFLRNDIENAIYNNKLYIQYEKQFYSLNYKTNLDLLNAKKLKLKKFKKIEKKLLLKNKIKNVDVINVKVIASYTSPKGKNHYEKKIKISFKDLKQLYIQWQQKNKYQISAKYERSQMNDSIRYDVLKRDNFRCVYCGASARDGVKLHVDHIIPVSKGGKTELSNLQTLCDRCNLGKSNKI